MSTPSCPTDQLRHHVESQAVLEHVVAVQKRELDAQKPVVIDLITPPATPPVKRRRTGESAATAGIILETPDTQRAVHSPIRTLEEHVRLAKTPRHASKLAAAAASKRDSSIRSLR